MLCVLSVTLSRASCPEEGTISLPMKESINKVIFDMVSPIEGIIEDFADGMHGSIPRHGSLIMLNHWFVCLRVVDFPSCRMKDHHVFTVPKQAFINIAKMFEFAKMVEFKVEDNLNLRISCFLP